MKKLFIAVFSALMMITGAFAVPGVEHSFKNISGAYIYYRDYSFNRESYIGFLIYDDSTYAARYFAPAAGNLEPINIELIFTVDPAKDYVDMTGERFLTPVKPEDTDIINYIHDLIYEFAARRKKAGLISPEVESDSKKNTLVKFNSSPSFMERGFVSHEDFNQFGGEVFVYYDYMIPVFNVKKIVNNANKNVFEAVAAGVLKSSQDRSFSEFSVIKEETVKPAHDFKNKKPKPAVYEVEGTKITLDENWSNTISQEVKMDNIFFHEGAALLGISALEKGQSYYAVLAQVLFSIDAYTPLDSVSIAEQKDRTTVYSTEIDRKSGEVYEMVTVVRKGGESLLVLFLNVSKGDFNQNRKYYLNILKGWK